MSVVSMKWSGDNRDEANAFLSDQFIAVVDKVLVIGSRKESALVVNPGSWVFRSHDGALFVRKSRWATRLKKRSE